eukprot:4150574-Amphidinium_carterae.1
MPDFVVSFANYVGSFAYKYVFNQFLRRILEDSGWSAKWHPQVIAGLVQCHLFTTAVISILYAAKLRVQIGVEPGYHFEDAGCNVLRSQSGKDGSHL